MLGDHDPSARPTYADLEALLNGNNVFVYIVHTVIHLDEVTKRRVIFASLSYRVELDELHE